MTNFFVRSKVLLQLEVAAASAERAQLALVRARTYVMSETQSGEGAGLDQNHLALDNRGKPHIPL